MEFGSGFAFMGHQYPIKVGSREFFIDLLFCNVKLHCYFVVELKTVEFEPEFAGKLSFYLSAIDGELKGKYDNPTIGLLLCKRKDKMVAEYALNDINKPTGISDYKLSNEISAALKESLPTVEDIEKRIND
ncbi:MAG: PDDEXK nuclease domain-containing protein [Hungatella sp.]|nr:PDDEXK nuclease domain-containing protein [Hungatella effluvii]